MGVSTRINRESCPKTRMWEKWAYNKNPGDKVYVWSFWRMKWEIVTLTHGDPEIKTWSVKETEESFSCYLMRPIWFPKWLLSLSKF